MKTTPIEKIYEAWTAVADPGRLDITPGSTRDEGSARVTSSDGSKHYDITWRDSGSIFTSTDAATRWQGYAGYPVVAVLMALGRIPLSREMAGRFAGINWTELNKAHRRDYAAAVAAVEQQRGIDPAEAAAAAREAHDALCALNLTLKRK